MASESEKKREREGSESEGKKTQTLKKANVIFNAWKRRDMMMTDACVIRIFVFILAHVYVWKRICIFSLLLLINNQFELNIWCHIGFVCLIIIIFYIRWQWIHTENFELNRVENETFSLHEVEIIQLLLTWYIYFLLFFHSIGQWSVPR